MNPVAGTRHQMPLKRQGASGQGLVEYALLLVLVSIVVIGVLSLLGTATQGVFGLAVGALQSEGKGVSSSANLRIDSATCAGGTVDFAGYSSYNPTELLMKIDLAGYTFTITSGSPGPFSNSVALSRCPQVIVLQHPPSGSIAAARVKVTG